MNYHLQGGRPLNGCSALSSFLLMLCFLLLSYRDKVADTCAISKELTLCDMSCGPVCRSDIAGRFLQSEHLRQWENDQL